MAKSTTINLDVKTNIPKVDKDINILNESLDTTDKTIEKIGETSKKTEVEMRKFGRTASKSMKKGTDDALNLKSGLKGVTATTRMGVQALTVYQGAVTLVGSESEELEQTLRKVIGVMALAQGIEGMVRAGEATANFGRKAVKALGGIRGAIIATGIGALVVLIGLLVAYWDDITSAVSRVTNGMGKFGKVVKETIKIALAPLILVIEGIRWGLEALGIIESKEEKGKKKRAKASRRRAEERRKEIRREIKELERLATKNKKFYNELEAYGERRLELMKLNGEASQDYEKQLLENKVKYRKKELEDVEKTANLEMGLIQKAYDGTLGLQKRYIKMGLTKSANALQEGLDNMKASFDEQVAIVKDANGEIMNAEHDLTVFKKENNNEEIEDAKEKYNNIKEIRRDVNNQLIDMDIEMMKEGFDKEKKLLENQYRIERETILNDTDLTRKQRTALITKLDDLEKIELERQQKEFDLRQIEIQNELTELKIANIKDETTKELAELKFKYELMEGALLENEEYTEKQKTEIRKQYAIQREAEETAIILQANIKKLEDQNIYNQARQLQEEDNFFKTQELKLEQAEIERDLALEQENLTANEKFLIQEQYQKKVTDLTEEAEEKRKEIKMAFIEAGFNLVNQGLAVLSALNDAYQGEDEQKKRQQFETNKKIQVASALISSAQGIVNIWSAPTTLPIPYDSIYRGIQTAFLVGTTAMQVDKIKSMQFQSSGSVSGASSGAGGGGAGNVISPEFNVVGNSGVNDLEDLGQQPIEAYVVSGNVTTAQSLDRNRVENATL